VSDRPEAASPAAPRNQALSKAHAVRLEKFERERLIVECLCHGLPVAEIAAQLDVTEKRMRAIIREILASRMPEPPEEFVAIQVSRLNEALILAHSAGTELALKKVDRVLRITRELDFYHGFGMAKRRRSRSAPACLEAPAEDALAFGAALFRRAETAPQDETLQPAPAPHKTSGPLAPEESAALADRPQNPSQQIEMSDSAPGLDAPWSAWRAWRERNRTAQAASFEPSLLTHGTAGQPSDRPQNPLQQIEKLESAPEIEAPCSAAEDGESEPTAQASPEPSLPATHAAAAPRADHPFTPVFDRKPLTNQDYRVRFLELIGSQRQSIKTAADALGNSVQLSEPMDTSDGDGFQSERATAWKRIFRARPNRGTAVGLSERDPWAGPRISA